jgi:glycerate dehydrogenase
MAAPDNSPTGPRPRIVVLDGFTMNPGDLSWDTLRTIAECAIHDRTSAGDIAARAQNADIVLTNKCPLRRETLARLPQLRFIGVTATGVNVVDLDAARESGIVVSNVPAYGTASVAQHVFALLLELTQRTGHHAHTVAGGRWSAGPDFCYWDFPLVELSGLTLGIVGYGEIGRAVARIGRAFGMNVLAATRTPRAGETGVAFAGMGEIFSRSDVVTLHCPLTPETEGLVNARRLASMKPTAFLINTGRGPLVVEADLAEALNAGRIAGAGLDVLSAEPPPKDNPLLASKNCIITPHIAWATRASRARLMAVVVANVRAFLAGRPQNVVCGA